MCSTPAQGGLVVLVGAGPGQPGLMTAEAARWLARAEAVLYDRLVNPSILAACSATAELIYVGKAAAAHAMSQDRINDLLIAKCREGKLVVRLKGGDPFIFGRGGEEAEALARAGCPFRVVPGVTAAIAAGACAGIPLTDRRLAATVAFITGHEDPAKDASAVNYAALAGIDTVVFYMGVGNLAGIAERLQAAGRGPDTPVAIVQEASTPRQRTVVATLATAARAAEQARIHPPAVLIVGEVVRLRERLAWTEKLPLFGRTILVTRTRRQASRLSQLLADQAARVIEAPTIEILPPDDWARADAALARLADYGWLILTSPNGVESLLGRMHQLGLDGRALNGVRLAAVGPATSEALQRCFLAPDLVPPEFTTDSLARAMLARGNLAGRRVLLARADIAPPALGDVLAAAGAEVDQITVYRTARPAALPEEALAALRAGQVNWVTFTSSSTVANFLALIEAAGLPVPQARLAAIGPETAKALRDRGLAPTVTARPHTVEALVEAIVAAEPATR